MATLHEARAREWQAEWFQRGHDQGIGRGQTELMRRQAKRKFDAETAERLSGLLDGLTDPERLAEVGEWIIECETGAELLDRTEMAGVSRPAGTNPGQAGDGHRDDEASEA